MLLLGVVSITFKGENTLCGRDMDVKEHHLSQVGVLAAHGGASYFRAFHPSPTYLTSLHSTCGPVTCWRGRGRGCTGGCSPLGKRALPPAEDFALGRPLATAQAGRRLFRRGASQWGVSLVVNGAHRQGVSPALGISYVATNTEPRHKEETGSVTFPRANTHSSTILVPL